MRKIIALLAVLVFGIATISYAFFGAADPKTTQGAANVKIPVYNNSGSALDEGDVVVWDIGSSTGDNDLYVTTTTTADTALVAGVVGPGGIAAASDGIIIVYGLATCDTSGLGAVNAGLLCTSTTAGAGDSCANSSTAASNYYAITAAHTAGSGEAPCFVTIR